MNITILDSSKIKYNGHYLEEFVTYNDIDDSTCQELINAKHAKEANANVPAISYATAPAAEVTPKFNVKENGGYVAEAVITEAQKAKLKAEGKLNDETPVTGKDNTQKIDKTPEPGEKTEITDENGKVLTDEEIAQKEAAARAGTGGNGEGLDPDKAPTVGELQNNGKEIPRI